MPNKQEAIVYVSIWCIVLAILYFSEIIISRSNSYTYPTELECKTLGEYIDIKKGFSATYNILSIWNYKLYLNEVKGKLQMVCPNNSKYLKDINLIVEGNILSRTSTSYISPGYYVNDCHNNHIFYVTPAYRQDPKFKNIIIINEIWSGDSTSLYGYVSRKTSTEQGFSVVDDNQKVLAQVIKNEFSLLWEVKVFEVKHPAANPNLLLLMVSKFSFNSKTQIDICNTSYAYINTFFIVLLVFLPLLIFYIIYSIVRPEVLSKPLIEESENKDSINVKENKETKDNKTTSHVTKEINKT